ncbi:MAG: bifunctional UDP-N-acetylglucosamine diphosphorylase/glucosamine-1-phosphate N-acetyltransferase GlmU, partial [Pseudomonadota bacterium]
MATALIVLAAGKGTRMKSDMPKVLHPIASAPMLAHAIRAGAALEPERIIVVAGHGADAVGKAAMEFDPRAQIVLQKEQLGTAHAVAQATTALQAFSGDAVVLYGDTPFVTPETLSRMAEARKTSDVVVLGFEAADPGRYGRLVMAGTALERIVEFKDANDEERSVTFCNSGIIMADAARLLDLVGRVTTENAAGEYYLTDIVALARADGLSATAIDCDESETLGINSRAELAAAEAAFQDRARAEALENGTTLLAPDTVFFALDTVIGRDTVIEQNVVFGLGVTVETGAHIRAFSHIEDAHIARGSVVGPFARVRGGTELSENVKIGNFVEVKNAQLDDGVKVNHLCYLGDAHIGQATNVGAGTITCNYDGVLKHRTTVGERAFIGSNTMLVAPVSVGDEAMTASGSVITKDVEPGALALARGQQVNKPGLARKMMTLLKAKKKKR